MQDISGCDLIQFGSDIYEVINSWLSTERLYHPQPEQWTCLRYTVGEIRELRRTPVYFQTVYCKLVEFLDLHKCENACIISEVFQLALYYESDAFTPRNVYPAGRIYPRTKGYVCPLRYRPCVYDINFIARLMVLPYRSGGSEGAIPNDARSYLRNDVIQWAIMRTKYVLVRDLLKYGVMYAALSDHEANWNFSYIMLHTLLKPTEQRALLDFDEMLSNFMSLGAESRRRMLSVIKAVEVLTFRQTQKEREVYLCFRLAFETIPEPFITGQEIKMFLRLCFSEQFAHALAEEMCSSYETFFPQGAQPRTPRSLLHLARCQVRQNLREVGHLPHGITDLNIPAFLKEYIVHTGSEFISDEFKRWSFPL